MPYQSQLTRQQPLASTEGQIFQTLSQRMSAFANRAQGELDREMQKKAKEKGLVDAQGKTEITLRDGSTIADEAWNDGAISSYTAAVKLDAEENLTRIGLDNPDDPEAYQVLSQRYAEGVIDGADESIRPAIKDMFAKSILKGTQLAEKNQRTNLRTEQGATLETGYSLSMDKAISLASEGDLEGMLDSITQAQENIDDLEAGGFINAKQANERKEKLGSATDKAVVMGQFNQYRRDGRGDEFLTKFIEKPPKSLDQDEVYKYANLMDKSLSRDIRISKRAQAEELAVISRERGKQSSDLSIAVSRGEAGEPDIEAAYQQRVISAEKRTSLIKELDAQAEKESKAAISSAFVTSALNAKTPLSSRNPDHRKAVDAYFLEMEADLTTDEGINQTVELVSSTTIMPKTVQEYVQAHSKSGDITQSIQAAEVVARINEKTPQALGSVPADVKAFSLLVSRNIGAGMDEEKAVELSRMSVYGLSEEDKRAYADEFKLNTKDYRENNRTYLNDKIDDDFDPNFFDSQPSTPLAMEAEFNLIVEEYIPLTKDLDTAKELAYKDLKNVWARTEINGKPEMTKYAPESYYGEGDWMREQLIKDVKKQLNYVGEINPQVVIDPRTAREAMPSYFVMVDENQVTDDNNEPLRWAPDYGQSKEAKERDEELAEMLEAARVEREEKTEVLPEPPIRLRNPQGELFNMESAM